MGSAKFSALVVTELLLPKSFVAAQVNQPIKLLRLKGKCAQSVKIKSNHAYISLKPRRKDNIFRQKTHPFNFNKSVR